MEIAEDEVEAVKTIFDKYIHTQLGVAGVAKFLNNEKNLRGNNKYEFFTPHLVKLILDNPVYYGKIAFGRRGTTRVLGTRDQFRLERKDNYIFLHTYKQDRCVNVYLCKQRFAAKPV